jgi:hypothetical protein
MSMLLLPRLQLLEVELGSMKQISHEREPQTTKAYLQLLALQNVTIGTSRLARAARYGSIQATGSKLGLKERIDFGICGKTISDMHTASKVLPYPSSSRQVCVVHDLRV